MFQLGALFSLFRAHLSIGRSQRLFRQIGVVVHKLKHLLVALCRKRMERFVWKCYRFICHVFVSTFEKKSPGSNTSGTTNRVSSSPPPPNRGASTLSGRTKRRCARVGPACKVRGVQGSSIPVSTTSGCFHPSLIIPRRMPCSNRFAADGTRVPRRSSCASAFRLETVDKS